MQVLSILDNNKNDKSMCELFRIPRIPAVGNFSSNIINPFNARNVILNLTQNMVEDLYHKKSIRQQEMELTVKLKDILNVIATNYTCENCHFIGNHDLTMECTLERFIQRKCNAEFVVLKQKI